MIEQVTPPGLPASPPCPFCEGTETELFSAFGSQLSVSTYWCRTCRSPFEVMKWTSAAGGYSRPGCERDGC
ncbi:MAG: hypothetical protein R3E10_16240 [Gemmatimonadota bacterium]